MRIVFFLISAIFFSFEISLAQDSQKSGFDPKYGFKDLAMDTWTNKSGLVSNNVLSVLQTTDDYLWITSYNGIQRFDGQKFNIYDQTNISFLKSNTIYEASQDIEGILWLSTGSSGIVGYDGENFFSHPLNASIPNSIVSLLADSKNRLWIGSKNNGLYLIDENQKCSKIEGIPSVTIHHLAEDQDGSIWVASDNSGAYKIEGKDIKRFSTDNGLKGNHISTVFPKGNAIYIGTLNGLNVIENNRVETIPAFDEDIINDLIVDDYGIIWVGTERGIVRYNREEDYYDFFSEEDGLPSKRVIDLNFDNEGSLWVCTYEGGLVRFKSGIITNLTRKDCLTTNQVHIINRKDDQFYIGTQDGNINVYDGDKMEYIDLKMEFKKDVIRDILFDVDEIWIANYKGLVRIKNGTKTYINESNGLPNNNLRTIFKDSRGIMWLGTRTGGLIKYDKNGNHEVIGKDTSNGLLTNYVLSIAETQNGDLLIGTNAGGLSIMNEKGEISNYSIQNDDSGTLIFNILVDDKNQIWLITNIGLYLFEEGTAKKAEFHPSLKMEKFFDMVDDGNGTFWMSSSIGVIRIDQQVLEDYFNGTTTTVSYEYFGEDDGMESQECTGATKSFIDKKTGKIWIPTFEGVAIIDPSQKVINQKIPKVYITSVQVDNNSIFPVKNNVQIRPGTFRYLFDVASLSFLAPSKVQFMYKLEGIDSDWNGPTKDRRIEYTNLPYGEYTLKVKGSNNDGIWNEEGAQLSFTVLPFYFETIWFRIGLLTFFILLAWGLYTWRVYDIKRTNRVLRKMNTELDHFVYSASHDLRGPLTSTMGIINLALNETDPKQRSEYFILIKQCTDKMNHFINELINYSKNKNDNLEFREFNLKLMIDSIWEGLKERSTINKITLYYDIDEDQNIVSDETRVKVILRNLLHNAVVFSDPGKKTSEIKIGFSQTNKHIEIAIIDNGLGIARNVRDRIFDMFYRANDHSVGSGLGLYVVKETAQKLNASIEVHSEEGRGSTFKLVLPKS